MNDWRVDFIAIHPYFSYNIGVIINKK